MLKEIVEKLELTGKEVDIVEASLRAFVNTGSSTIGLPYWAAKDPKVVKELTKKLVDKGIAKVKVTSKWSEMTIDFTKIGFSREELDKYREQEKFEQYSMKSSYTVSETIKTKTINGYIESGLKRYGFQKIVGNRFKLDTAYLQKYKTEIIHEIIKGIEKQKQEKKIENSYFSEIVPKIIQSYIDNPDKFYSLEEAYCDNRGRAIFKAQKRVGNPIASKEIRACMKVDGYILKSSDNDSLAAIYKFIAELLGEKRLTESRKFVAGIKAYFLRKLPDETYERIWLERIYDKLDILIREKEVYWNIPIEVDATMSVAQIVGALTNDVRLLERTNVVGKELTDAWHVENVPRKAMKTVGTPVFYGSSKSAYQLLLGKGIELDDDTIALIQKEMNNGAFGIIRKFKDALIKNSKIETPTFKCKIWNDDFSVVVNKKKPVGSKPVITEAYTGTSYKYSVTREVQYVPDYKRFKLYFATLLVHNLDSQIMNSICSTADYWIMPIHDAAIVLPKDINKVRQQYVLLLQEINKNRKAIINTYRKSIGATSVKTDYDFMMLSKAVINNTNKRFKVTAMK